MIDGLPLQREAVKKGGLIMTTLLAAFLAAVLLDVLKLLLKKTLR